MVICVTPGTDLFKSQFSKVNILFRPSLAVTAGFKALIGTYDATCRCDDTNDCKKCSWKTQHTLNDIFGVVVVYSCLLVERLGARCTKTHTWDNTNSEDILYNVHLLTT